MLLTANYSGSEKVSYLWKNGETNVGTNSNKYTPPEAGSYTVTVSAAGYNNKTSAAVTVTGASLPALTGTVSIIGDAEVEEILTANTSLLGGSGTISYQWKRGTVNIGTDSSSYTVQSADIGSTITVTVTRSGNSGSITSAPTAVVTAETPPTPGLIFTLMNGSYSVSRGTATAAEVVIPAFYNGLPVTAIADNGFSSYTNMTSIRIPDSVLSIGQSAFNGCSGLTSVTFQGAMATFSSTSSFPGDLRDKYFEGGIGTYIRQSDSEMWYNTVPIATYFTISGTRAFLYDGIAKPVTVTAKTGASGGAVTVKYNGSTTAPSAVGTYTVAFDVAASGNFIEVRGLSAGRLMILAPPEINMVWVSGGSFQMGIELGTAGEGDTTPVHTVTLSGFYMGKYEVTYEQYYLVMSAGLNSSNFPATAVSWYNAIVFCNKLSIAKGLSPAYRISGSTNPSDWGTVPYDRNDTWDAAEIVSGSTGYRLPTEAQWEYAAKGGNGSPGNYTYSGSNTIGDVAWHFGNSGDEIHEVGKKQPNGLGIYDMSGNAWEWCWDWIGAYSGSTQTDPVGVASGSQRVLRGGNWRFNATYARSVDRFHNYPNIWGNDFGFRLVRP
jgi:formylglycine-generating enzyme required for sulfatase activity